MTRPATRASRRPPEGLCPTHTRIWRDWAAYPDGYDPRHPKEAGGGMLMDSRTSHTERRARWQTLADEQCTLTEGLCRSRRSPQCDWPTVTS